MKPIITLDQTASCDEIIHHELLSVPFDEVGQGKEQAEAWILTHFLTATVEFVPSQRRGPSEVGVLSWPIGENRLFLHLQDGFHYAAQSSRLSPTLGQILRCFGAPEYYTLGRGNVGGEVPSGVRLDLWYPDRGLYFNSVTWGANEIRRYTVNSPIVSGQRVKVMPPGSVEEMMQDGGISMEQYIDKQQAVLKKWPDTFTELVLEE